jgi:hypothetical protein
VDFTTESSFTTETCCPISYPNMSIVCKRWSSSGSTTLSLLARNTSKTKILRRPSKNYCLYGSPGRVDNSFRHPMSDLQYLGKDLGILLLLSYILHLGSQPFMDLALQIDPLSISFLRPHQVASIFNQRIHTDSGSVSFCARA